MKNKKVLRVITKVLSIAELLYGLFNAAVFLSFVGRMFSWHSDMDEFALGPLSFTSIEGTSALDIYSPWYLSFLWFVISFIGYLMLRHIHKFFKNASEDRVFVSENAHSLKWIGYYLFIIVSVSDLLQYLYAKVTVSYILIKNGAVAATYHVSITYLIGVIAFIFVGYVFKIAVDAVEENEKTI